MLSLFLFIWILPCCGCAPATRWVMTSAHPLRENNTEQKGQKILKNKKGMRREHKHKNKKKVKGKTIQSFWLKNGGKREGGSTREGKLNIYIIIMQRKAGCLTCKRQIREHSHEQDDPLGALRNSLAKLSIYITWFKCFDLFEHTLWDLKSDK